MQETRAEQVIKIIWVGLTSIGSGVGQAVINSCRLSKLPLYAIGYGNTSFAFGAFDCDERKILPSIYSAEYPDALLAACRRDRIDILIPGLDDELLPLARHAEKFKQVGTMVAVSNAEMLELCRDKALMWTELSKISDAFVRSYTRNSLLQAARDGLLEYPLIAKPLSGFASRGLFIIHDESGLSGVTDAHVVQEIAVPVQSDPNREVFLKALQHDEILQLSEISAQVLIARDGRELGRFASYNRLSNGVPVEIMPVQAPDFWLEIDKLLPRFKKAGLMGPLNIQGRLTDDGPRFFEMNARFTGITGVRALMGFNEVEALIADFSGAAADNRFSLRQHMRKIGIRQVADRVVDVGVDTALVNAVESTGQYPWKKQGRRILVTGANGYLGRAVLDVLLASPVVDSVVAMVRNPTRFDGVHEPALPAGIEMADTASLFAGGFPMGGIDVICHLASGRPHDNAVEIAESLQLTQALISCAIQHQIPGFIYASSQAVYGTARPPLWCEELPAAPETAFAQSKWAAELMAASMPQLSRGSKATSLRFAQLIGPSPVRDNVRLVHKYIDAAIAGESLQVMGGRQHLDFLDLRDAAGLVTMLAVAPFDIWPGVLNVSSGESVSVLDLAHEVAAAAGEFGLNKPLIKMDPDFSFPDFGMSREKAQTLLGWVPGYTLRQTLLDLFSAARP